jgi:hypothetical protein
MVRPEKNDITMKIEHTTYEGARSAWRTSRPVSATQKVKGYFGSRPPGHSNQESQESLRSAADEKPIRRWRSLNTSRSNNPPNAIAFETQQLRVQKISEKDQGAASLHVQHQPAKKPGKSILMDGKVSPQLRRKPNFKNSLQEKFRSHGSAKDQERGESGRKTLAKAHDLRSNIREGKLERVVPPGKNPAVHQRQTPPRPSSLTKPSYRSKNISTSSSKVSNEVLEYFRTSADILDETRRELAGKFKPPFENLNYSPFSGSRRDANVDESDGSGRFSSDESFCCIGENDITQDSKSGEARKEARARRLSGDGTDPWTSGPPQTCRLCYKAEMGCSKGLCRQCKIRIIKPDPAESDSPGSWSSGCRSSGDEIRPIPPLKDKKYMSLRPERYSSISASSSKELPLLPMENESDDERFLR